MAGKNVLTLLREAHRHDPVAFDNAVRDYLERGIDAFAPRAAGARKRLKRENYVLLLASMMNRPEGMSEAARLRDLAEKGVKYGDGRNTYRWFNSDTIKSHLAKAKQLADDEPEFAEDVEFYRWALRVINSE